MNFMANHKHTTTYEHSVFLLAMKPNSIPKNKKNKKHQGAPSCEEYVRFESEVRLFLNQNYLISNQYFKTVAMY